LIHKLESIQRIVFVQQNFKDMLYRDFHVNRSIHRKLSKANTSAVRFSDNYSWAQTHWEGHILQLQLCRKNQNEIVNCNVVLRIHCLFPSH